jgi:hypothetical protein
LSKGAKKKKKRKEIDVDDDDVATSLYKQDIDLEKTMRCALRGLPPLFLSILSRSIRVALSRLCDEDLGIGEDENSSERRTGTSSSSVSSLSTTLTGTRRDNKEPNNK